MITFREFINNIKILGYKEKVQYLKDIIPEKTAENYENVFIILNEVISNMNNKRKNNNSEEDINMLQPLNKREKNIYESKLKNNQNFNQLNCNKNILDLSIDIIDSENLDLEKELSLLEKEIEKNENILLNEENENKILNDKVKQLNEYEISYFETQLEKFNENNLKKIKEKSESLNKSIVNIIAELNLNENKSKILEQSGKYIVGYRKIENSIFDMIMELILKTLDKYENYFNEIIENAGTNNNIDMSEIYDINKRLDLVSDTEYELKTNFILSEIKTLKEKYKNSLINDYIINHNVVDLNYKSKFNFYEVDKTIQTILSDEKNLIINKYSNIKNKYIKKIYEQILAKNFIYEINFIENFDGLGKIINSIYPYLLNDLNVTQEIYDKICEVIEIYNNFQTNIAIKQGKLRKYYGKESNKIDKITIDDRDSVLLSIANEFEILNKNNDYYPEKEKKVKIYEINKVLNQVNSYINSKIDDKNIIKIFCLDIISSSKNLLNYIHSMQQNSNYISNIKKFNNFLVKYQDDTQELIKLFLNGMNKIIIKKKFNINNDGVISLYEAFYLFLFCRHIYDKEISPFENIFEYKK
jgi:hypothetical protein